MSDPNKPDMSQIPLKALEEVAQVFTYGCSKEGRKKGDWQHLDDDLVLAALLRHLGEHQYGNHVDKESGRKHIAHACCNAIILLANILRRERDAAVDEKVFQQESDEIPKDKIWKEHDLRMHHSFGYWVCNKCGEAIRSMPPQTSCPS